MLCGTGLRALTSSWCSQPLLLPFVFPLLPLVLPCAELGLKPQSAIRLTVERVCSQRLSTNRVVPSQATDRVRALLS